jgi:hypothetical protein
VYASSSSALATGSALTFDGSTFGVTGAATVTGDISTTSTGRLNLRGSGTGVNYDFQLDNDDSLAYFRASRSNAVTKGYVWYLNNSTTEAMRLTSTGLGIGTSSPAFKLDVSVTDTTAYSTSAYSYEPMRITNNGAGGVSGILFQALSTGTANTAQATISVIAESASSKNTAITFGTRENSGGTIPERLRIDSAGNLGLGVTPSAWVAYKALQVGSTGGALSSSSSSDFEITTNAYYSGGWLSQGAGVASSRYRLLSGTHAWFNAPSGTAGNAISFTQAMTLDASGNLLVGTTSNPDTARLHVSKASGEVARFSSPNGTNSYITLGRNDATGEGMTLGYSSSTGDCTISTITTHPLIFRTNNTERARIDSSGNLLVGTTSGGNRKLEVVTTGTNHAISCLSDTAGYATIECINSAASGTRNFIGFRASRGGADVGSITYNGTLTAYNTTSDYRLKTVHGAVTGHGSRIDALEPVEYTWNANGTRTRGFLAHKFQEVYAGSVTGEKDAVDADGNPVYQAMQASTAEVIADLVAEIQSLRQRLSAANL